MNWACNCFFIQGQFASNCFSNITEIWCVGRVFVLRHHLRVVSGLLCHGLVSVMEGRQIQPKKRGTNVLLQERLQTIFQTLLHPYPPPPLLRFSRYQIWVSALALDRLFKISQDSCEKIAVLNARRSYL